MDAQIERHQPLITARIIFVPKAFPQPPIITARMEFPSITVFQHERSPTPEVTPRCATTSTRRPTRLTPIQTQKAVAFEQVDKDLESPLTPASDKSDKSESEGVGSTKTPKPPGSAGRPQSGGYNLQDTLGWNDTTYQSITVSFLNMM